MPVVTRNDFLLLPNSMELILTHFARGTYPCGGAVQAYPMNRCIMVASNDNPKNYVRDANVKLSPGAGSVIFIPCFHPCEVCFDEKLVFLSVHFHMQLFLGPDVFSGLGRLLCEHAPVVVERGFSLYESREGIPGAAALKGFIFEVAASRLELVSEDVVLTASGYAKYRMIIDFVSKNCCASIRVSMLAGMMNMSRGTFGRAFKRDTGISPGEFLNRSLLQKASRMLLSGKKVKETAYELNFSSEYYFSRFFKKHVGVPPSEFQASHSQQTGSEIRPGN